MLFLTTMPLWLSGLLLIVPTTALAMAGPYVVRRYVELSRLRTNNEIAGFKFATVGVLYAVLLAFAVIVVWEKFNEADNLVAKEAGAAATIYRLSRGINVEEGAAVSEALTAYLTAAITKDWPAMQLGKASPTANEALNGIYSAVLKFHPADNSGAILLAELLRQVDLVSEGRRACLVTANGIVPGIVWLVLFGGAAITNRLHVLLRRGKSPRPVGDDGGTVRPDVCRAADDCRHRPSLRRPGEGWAGGADRGRR
jgi:hypothetical protein